MKKKKRNKKKLQWKFKKHLELEVAENMIWYVENIAKAVL